MEAQQELVAYLTAEQTPGARSRQLTVPDQHVALVQERRGMEVLPPGTHRLLSGWDVFLGRGAPPVWLMPQGAITMQPAVTNLLSFDRQMMEADMLIQTRIVDPQRLWQELVGGQVSLERRQVEHELARRLQPVLGKHVRQYLPDALQHQAEPVDEIQRVAMPSLRAILEGWGLELLAVTYLGVRPALDVVDIQRQRQAIEQKLADLRLQGQIDDLEREHILQHARDEMVLSEADEVRIQMLSEERNALEALTQVLQERLQRLENTVHDRLDQLAGAPPARDQAAAVPSASANHTVERMEDWVSVLRLLGSGLALLTTASVIFFPHVFPDQRGLELAAVSFGFLAALLAFIGSWAVHRQIHRHQARARASATQAEQAAERQARIDQERGIRRYLEQRLRQVSSNCDHAWRRVYEHDMNLATSLRNHCSAAYIRLADQVRTADYGASYLLSQSHATLDDLTQLLALSQDVLNQAQRMVDLSQSVYNAASASPPDLATAERGCTQLDQGCVAIANRFAERDQFLSRSDTR